METNRNTRILIGILILIIIGLLLNNCKDRPSSKEVPPPSQTISMEQARTLQREFVGTRSDIINKTLGFEDTRDFWFSLDSLEQYIRYVRSESTKQGLEDLGLRIYYAAYPEESKEKWPDPGFSTVIIVPTYGKPDLSNGFFPSPPVQRNSNVRSYNYAGGGKPPKDL
ncbi:hypothetical protein [Ulvibacterium marinum]|uniref:Uncharacterized protein n=1 Tax=Ulvibacterium marinum TaxID=2419782 RepID=A0A3B0CDL1_9FLAO|nr:hypothetical protein [Ulvibacterium marinum]RKN82634.1 hypothetical protein D7Z94_01975 [Ulvibacterium marinum]